MINAFKDSKSKPISSTDLLPFRDQIEDPKNSVSQYTIRVLIRLIKTKKLPLRVISEAKKIREIEKEFPYE